MDKRVKNFHHNILVKKKNLNTQKRKTIIAPFQCQRPHNIIL